MQNQPKDTWGFVLRDKQGGLVGVFSIIASPAATQLTLAYAIQGDLKLNVVTAADEEAAHARIAVRQILST